MKREAIVSFLLVVLFLISVFPIRTYSGTVDAHGGSGFFGTQSTADRQQSTAMTNSLVGLVGYWRFDEGSGTTAHDTSGNGNDGTINGATWVDGKYAKALSFDGTDDYVEIPNSASLNPNTITVEAWVKFDVLPSELKGIVTKRTHGVEDGHILSLNSAGSFRFGVMTSNGRQEPSGAIKSAGVFYHVVGTYDGSNVSVYVNGIEEASASLSGSISNNPNSLRIGTYYNSILGWFFDGTIDEVKIYNRALSLEEIDTEFWGVNILQSTNIAVVPDTSGGVSTSTLPTSGFSGGYAPTFTSIGYAGVNYANLLQYDTAIMYQATPDLLGSSQKADLVSWVSGGGKLIIWDSDAVPNTNYNWLPYAFTSHYPGQTGSFGGNLAILANNTLGSSDMTSPYYINTTNIAATTDAIGDAKVFLTHNSNWYGHMWATNVYGYSGFTHAYAYYPKGIVIYSGLDTDALGTDGWITQNQWLFKTYELELRLQCPPPITPAGPIAVTYDDVAVTNVTSSKTVVGQGFNLNVSVTGGNPGDYPETFDLTLNANSGPVANESGLVGYWKFDEGSGTTAYDSSGNGNDGILMNGPAWIDGKYGKALSFDGVDDWVNIPLTMPKNGTFSLWFKDNLPSSDPTVRYWFDVDGTDRICMYHDATANVLTFFSSTADNVYLMVGVIYNAYEWHNLAGTWKSGETKLYFDGTPVISTSATLTNQSYGSALNIGRRYDYIQLWNGTIDEVRVWNRTLSEEEIRTLVGFSQTRTVVNLPPHTSTTIPFTWNTSGFAFGNYTLSAYARPVPGETNISNNNFTGGWVIVSLPGDITGQNGWPDGVVDMRDIGYVARRFMCKPGDPLWDPNADINNDGIIDMRDIGTVARHFGDHYP